MLRFISDPKGLKDQSTEGVPLQVIGAGVPRAATSSMQAAFEKLGFSPTMHMAEILPHASLMRLFTQAVQEKNTEVRHKLIRKLIHGHVAICDLPVLYFTPDLMDMYPNAKVILNQRPSAEAWSRSARDSFGYIFSSWFGWSNLLWPSDRMWYNLNMNSVRWAKEMFGTNDILSAEFYNAYNDHVRKEAKKRGREILEYMAEDGWGPLCAVLDRPVPEEPFPKLNERRTFKIAIRIIIARGILCWLALFVVFWGVWKMIVGFM